MNLKKGVKLVEEIVGMGRVVERQKSYILAIRITLNKGDVVKMPNKCLSHAIDNNLKVNDDGFLSIGYE